MQLLRKQVDVREQASSLSQTESRSGATDGLVEVKSAKLSLEPLAQLLYLPHERGVKRNAILFSTALFQEGHSAAQMLMKLLVVCRQTGTQILVFLAI